MNPTHHTQYLVYLTLWFSHVTQCLSSNVCALYRGDPKIGRLTVLERDLWNQSQFLVEVGNQADACANLIEIGRLRRVIQYSDSAALPFLCYALRHGWDCGRYTGALQQAIAHRRPGAPRHIDVVVTVTDWNMMFVYTGLPYALASVSEFLTAQLEIFDMPTWMSYCKAPTELFPGRRALLVVEAAYIRFCMPVVDIRKLLMGNGPIIVLGGDSVLFPNYSEYDNPMDADMHIDLLDGVAVALRKSGAQSDVWMWTPSRTLLTLLEHHMVKNDAGQYVKAGALYRPNNTAIMLMSMYGEGNYRHKLLSSLQKTGLEVIFGKGGMAVETLVDVMDKYSKAFVSIGSTSGSWSDACRTMKGFRDWVAPILGAVIVYDDHPDVLRKYPVPIYNYSDPTSLVELIRQPQIMADGAERRQLLFQQKQWVHKNTMDHQLVYYVRRLLKLTDSMPAKSRSWPLPKNISSISYGACIQGDIAAFPTRFILSALPFVLLAVIAVILLATCLRYVRLARTKTRGASL